MKALTGPRFGSYEPEDVSWLLTDLSDVSLELDTATRERRIQDGLPYHEVLPIEYEPSPEYVELYQQSLKQSARRVALAVGTLAELMDDRFDRFDPVLVSLARAGTPVGILVKRWLKRFHGLDAPHYTISIIRDLGIDTAALDYILDRHPPRLVQFVDGWTGKGAIAAQLAISIKEYNADKYHHLSPDLAVLADPGSCTELFGTRDDFLIPSACLNSTVSGLVSRTVYSPELIEDGQFHGAKFYSELAEYDLSNAFLQAIEDEFENVEDELPDPEDIDRTPVWSGRELALELAAELDIPSINMIKPGVGETTRVLLRRVPWMVLVDPAHEDELQHVLYLADARGVPVQRRELRGYSCVGLIRQLDAQ